MFKVVLDLTWYNGDNNMKTGSIYVIVLLFCQSLGVLFANGETNRLAIEDFGIRNSKFIVTLENNIDQNFGLLESLGPIYGPIDNGWNVLSYMGQGIEIGHIRDFSLTFHIIVTSNSFATHRNIRVGDRRSVVEAAYDLEQNDRLYMQKEPDKIIIQQVFFASENLPNDTLESYEGEIKKRYSLTFYFDGQDTLTRIISNVAY